MKKFYLGMDIGTDSVGMACTDENYNLLRAKGKDLWAVRLFDEAHDASERRMKRSSRRRLARRKQRIDFLQEIFYPFMEDKLFFLRLDNSGFYEEDKDVRLNTSFSLFADIDYSDREFYKEYPTIFHLRKALIDGKTKKDLRLYYLALHHIIKYRGHFLYEGESVSAVRDISKLFMDFNVIAGDVYAEDPINLSLEKAQGFCDIALSNKGVNDKKKAAVQLFGFTKQTEADKEWVDLLLGAKVKVAKLLKGEVSDENQKATISFKEVNDEKFEEYRDIFGDFFSLLEQARAIYSYILFENILSGNDNISSAMVGIYDKHKQDLTTLKAFVKKNYSREVYDKIFRSTTEKANYVNYIGSNKSGKEKIFVKKCKTEDFYKFLKKTLEDNSANIAEYFNVISQDIEKEKFLPKILNADNGVFPHQINGEELQQILKNLCCDYPQFAEKDSDGFTPAEKIWKIFTFKIPYYVGPLNDAHKHCGGNSWIVKKGTGRITPWNFDQMVDRAKSNEAFIERMTNKCTYLYDKNVLPKCSMYYQAYDTLTQINKLKINGQPISVGQKQALFTDLFLKSKKVGIKNIKNYFIRKGACTKDEAQNMSITGAFDVDVKASMSSYVILKGILGDLVDTNPEMCEKIIFWHTLNPDKSMVEECILKEYGHIPVVVEKIKILKGITSFKDFGRFSKELLCEIPGGVNCETGEIYTILERLYNTNDNLNELLAKKEYSFQSAIDDTKAQASQDVDYQDVAELYVSPMVRRGVWQAMLMTDEYVNAVGRAPDKIFIEVTRGDGKKERTQSRKNKLLDLYKGLKDDVEDLAELCRELNGKSDMQLRQERLYLYFLQLGKCAYSGERIDLEQLPTNMYDVDHIVPRSMTKDDSIDNKVLVLRKMNEEKGAEYPLNDKLRKQQREWRFLKDKGLMSEKKYSLLTRVNPMGEEDFNEFVNRQLVVTNQTAKAVAELLARKYGPCGTKIVYSKAGHVNDFKQQYDIVKCRETNDLHHARDAYLNIAVGNVYDTNFTCARDYFYKHGDDGWREYNLKNLFNKPTKGAWLGKEDVVKVKSVLQKCSMQVTRYSYINKGEFYKQTICNKDDEGVAVPRKNFYPYTQTEKYGGYKSLSTAYFTIVQSKDKKGNLIKTIEAIPVLVDYNCHGDEKKLLDYLVSKGLNTPKLLVKKLKLDALISINGYRAWIAGKNSDAQIKCNNAQQWITDSQTDLYVKSLVKLVQYERENRLSDKDKMADHFDVSTNRKGEVGVCINAENNIKLYRGIIDKLSSKAYKGLSCVENFKNKISDKKCEFEQLIVFEQAKVLLQIVAFMKCNAVCADLSLLGEGKWLGRFIVSNNITNVDFAIIHQSPCGLVTRIQKV